MERVLIVEDDPALLRGLKDNFEFQGYQVVTAKDGESGLEQALGGAFDLIVLDVMLPLVNGYEIVRTVRGAKIESPILMLTARDQESDVVTGLRLGADDYVTKPFSVKELLARCDAILRRRRLRRAGEHRFGDCLLDVESRRLMRGTIEVKLSPKEFELLQFLAENAGKALSRERIMDAVWGYESEVTPRSIDRFVNALRNKIEPKGAEPRHIQTVREFGYKFVMDEG